VRACNAAPTSTGGIGALQDRLGKLLADDRGNLQHRLVAFVESIDARRQHRLDGGWNLDLAHRPRQAHRRGAIGSGAHEDAIVEERVHDLLDEERVAAGTRADVFTEDLHRRVGAEQITQQGNAGRVAERRERDVLVARLLHPPGLILGAEVHHQQRACRREDLDQAVERRLARGVQPMQVFEQQHCGQAARAGLDESAYDVEQAALAGIGIHTG